MSHPDFDLVIFDLDGTLYASGTVIPGAAEAVTAVRNAGIAIRFATNTFSTPREKIADRLALLGIKANLEEIVTPHDPLATWFSSRQDSRCATFVNPELLARMDYLPPATEGRPDFVLVADADTLWSYDAIDLMLRHLCEGAELIATSGAGSFIGGDGNAHIDSGALVALLEAASGKKARIMGKPGIAMAERVIKAGGFSPDRTLILGDDPSVDVVFARAAGARSLLVKTGKPKLPGYWPEADDTMDSVADLPRMLGLGGDHVSFLSKRANTLPTAPEFPISVEVNGKRFATLMCTPSDLAELATGWLVTRGVVSGVKDLARVHVCESMSRVEVATVSLETEETFGLGDVIASGCGSGIVFSSLYLARPEVAQGGEPVPMETLASDSRTMFREAYMYKDTGGMHCASLVTDDGRHWTYEDVGRHNAVDKAIGRGLREGVDFSRTRILTSGRIAADMILKAVAVGVPVLASRSIPTETALEIARKSKVTVVGRIGSDRQAVYCHPERISE